MPLNIKIENFEGPFDLLLHLIKKSKMDIYNIRIHEITNQYLKIINELDEMNLETTSQFIVIAATLIEIKSKLLLPKIEDEIAATEEDPRKLLISKLLEYKKFKIVAEYLKEKEGNFQIMYSKKAEIIETKKEKIELEQVLQNISMLNLYDLFIFLINNYKNKMNTSNVIDKNILIDKYKIEDKIDYIKNKFSGEKSIKFSQLIDSCEVKIEAVVTFLALLELIKLKVVTVLQEGNFKEIFIERIELNE